MYAAVRVLGLVPVPVLVRAAARFDYGIEILNTVTLRCVLDFLDFPARSPKGAIAVMAQLETFVQARVSDVQLLGHNLR